MTLNAAQTAVARLAAVYGEPKTPNPDMFADEFVRALTGYDARLLEAAVDRVVRESTFWPKPAEVIAAARSVAAALYASKPAEHKPIEPRIERTPEAKAEVDRLIDEFRRDVAARALDGNDRERERATDWSRGNRDGFAAMQSESSTGLHRQGLSSASRRMSGEKDD